MRMKFLELTHEKSNPGPICRMFDIGFIFVIEFHLRRDETRILLQEEVSRLL